MVMNPDEILESNKDYLKTRIHEVFCNEHGLIRYWQGIFQGCYMCPADRDIQDQIMKSNLKSLKSEIWS